ncbi:MAG: EamA family transporter RarD, partial [Geminicoccaceae bacterium]
MPDQPDSRAGLVMAATAFTLWGVYPFYFKALEHVPPLEIVAHRIFWSTLTLAPLIQLRGAWPEVMATLFDSKLRWGLLASTLLIAANWFVYVVAVTSGNVLDASLGYFLCPLVSVALGVAFLKERLSRAQKASVALASAAVVLLIVMLGIVPKIALFLAISFGLYGLAKKRLPIDPNTALFLECALLVPASVVITVWLAASGTLETLEGDPRTVLLLALSGIVTVGPLLLFAMGAKRLPLSTIGVLQYIAPSMLFL